MHLISLVLIAAMISGCAATYKQNTLAEPSAKLVSGKSVVISTPSNGFYENKEYSASGRMTALAVRAAFARFTNSTTVVPDCSDLMCLKQDQSVSHDYYVIPEILHWEDRATEWSGIPDKIKVKVSVYDGQSAKELASTIISGKSKWATFGGDHPQDLLPEPLNKYVESLSSMLNFYIERVLTIRSSGLPKAALLPSAELKRCYDFRGQELGEDFLRFHPFFTLLIGRGGASKDDGGSRGYPWVGSPLTGVRQGPASPEGRGL